MAKRAIEGGVVTPARFERAAFGLGIRRSIRLSYGVNTSKKVESEEGCSPHKKSFTRCVF